jgi:hypothetical protein
VFSVGKRVDDRSTQESVLHGVEHFKGAHVLVDVL